MNEIPRPPDHLNAEGTAEWLRIVPVLQDVGKLDVLALSTIEAYCAAYGLWREARAEVKKSGAIVKLPGSDKPVRNPFLDIENEQGRIWRAFARDLDLLATSTLKPGGDDGDPMPAGARRVGSYFGRFGHDA